MLVSEDLVGAIFGPDPSSDLIASEAYAKVLASTQELATYVVDMEDKMRRFKEQLRKGKEETLTMSNSELFPQIDFVIEFYARQEKVAAERLAEHRATLKGYGFPLLPESQEVIDRLEKLMIDRAETFRDARWDLMGIRASRRANAEVLPKESISDLRRSVGRR